MYNLILHMLYFEYLFKYPCGKNTKRVKHFKNTKERGKEYASKPEKRT